MVTHQCPFHAHYLQAVLCTLTLPPTRTESIVRLQHFPSVQTAHSNKSLLAKRAGAAFRPLGTWLQAKSELPRIWAKKLKRLALNQVKWSLLRAFSWAFTKSDMHDCIYPRSIKPVWILRQLVVRPWYYLFPSKNKLIFMHIKYFMNISRHIFLRRNISYCGLFHLYNNVL